MPEAEGGFVPYRSAYLVSCGGPFLCHSVTSPRKETVERLQHSRFSVPALERGRRSSSSATVSRVSAMGGEETVECCEGFFWGRCHRANATAQRAALTCCRARCESMAAGGRPARTRYLRRNWRSTSSALISTSVGRPCGQECGFAHCSRSRSSAVIAAGSSTAPRRTEP